MNFKDENPTAPRLTETSVREISEQVVRNAVRQQARDLEKHLASIHDRLVALEVAVAKLST